MTHVPAPALSCGSTARLVELPQRQGVPPDEHPLRGCVERGQSSEGKKVKRPKAQHPLLVSPFYLVRVAAQRSKRAAHYCAGKVKRSKPNAWASVLAFGGFTLLPILLFAAGACTLGVQPPDEKRPRCAASQTQLARATTPGWHKTRHAKALSLRGPLGAHWDRRCGACLAEVPFRGLGPRNGHAWPYRAGARMDAGWPGSFSLGPASVSLPSAM